MFRAISSFCPEVITINFSNNEITTLEKFPFSKYSFRNLVNLSFDSNGIKTFEQIATLRHIKLRELWLKNNPVSSQLANNFEAYSTYDRHIWRCVCFIHV